LASCAREEEKPIESRRASTQQGKVAVALSATYEQLGPIEDQTTNYAPDASRELVVRIAIPAGYSRDEVTETLRHVAVVTAGNGKVAEVKVFAYGTRADLLEPYNIGRVIYTSGFENSGYSQPPHFDFDLVPSYFTGDPVVRPAASTRKSVTVAAATYGKKWPFPGYTSVRLECEVKVFRGTRRPMATVEVGGIRYAFNYTAEEIGGFPSPSPVLKNVEPYVGMGEHYVIDDLRDMSTDLCYSTPP
jgi:hypothetical protein